MSDGQEGSYLNQSTQLIAKKASKSLSSRNNLKTFQAENRGIFENSQLQIKFTGSYKETECISFCLVTLP